MSHCKNIRQGASQLRTPGAWSPWPGPWWSLRTRRQGPSRCYSCHRDSGRDSQRPQSPNKLSSSAPGPWPSESGFHFHYVWHWGWNPGGHTIHESNLCVEFNTNPSTLVCTKPTNSTFTILELDIKVNMHKLVFYCFHHSYLILVSSRALICIKEPTVPDCHLPLILCEPLEGKLVKCWIWPSYKILYPSNFMQENGHSIFSTVSSSKGSSHKLLIPQ